MDLRRGAGHVLEKFPRFGEDAQLPAVEAALAMLPADDPTRQAVEAEFEKRGCGPFRGPHRAWVELR